MILDSLWGKDRIMSASHLFPSEIRQPNSDWRLSGVHPRLLGLESIESLSPTQLYQSWPLYAPSFNHLPWDYHLANWMEDNKHDIQYTRATELRLRCIHLCRCLWIRNVVPLTSLNWVLGHLWPVQRDTSITTIEGYDILLVQSWFKKQWKDIRHIYVNKDSDSGDDEW